MLWQCKTNPAAALLGSSTGLLQEHLTTGSLESITPTYFPTQAQSSPIAGLLGSLAALLQPHWAPLQPFCRTTGVHSRSVGNPTESQRSVSAALLNATAAARAPLGTHGVQWYNSVVVVVASILCCFVLC